MLEIYTDGSCIGNPGPGSRGFIVFEDGKETMRNRGDIPMTTNNQMELQATIEALNIIQNSKFKIQDDNQSGRDDLLGRPQNVTICTDSKYVYEGITSYIHDRKRRGWRLASKGPVKNLAQWQELDTLVGAFPGLQWKWVKGHAHDKKNNQVDRMIRG